MSLGTIGLPGSVGPTDFWLRKRLKSNTFVPAGTAQHLGFTLTGPVSINQVSDGVPGSPVTTSLLATGADDAAGNRPLAINTATTIP